MPKFSVCIADVIHVNRWAECIVDADSEWAARIVANQMIETIKWPANVSGHEAGGWIQFEQMQHDADPWRIIVEEVAE